ncbi:hypothetical protein CCR91_17870 [Thiorhodovibrio winogradskyi]|nr:hypothetical protein [Thiorhodovibrio winogradskyi]
MQPNGSSYQAIHSRTGQRRPAATLAPNTNFRVSADFWLNLQVRWDLVRAQTAEAEELACSEDFHRLKKWPKVTSQW